LTDLAGVLTEHLAFEETTLATVLRTWTHFPTRERFARGDHRRSDCGHRSRAAAPTRQMIVAAAARR
jgi:hypothetical protein